MCYCGYSPSYRDALMAKAAQKLQQNELQSLLEDPGSWDELLEILGGLTPRQRKAHQALFVDAVRLDNPHESLKAVQDLLEAFPDWLNATDQGKNTAVAMAAAMVRLDVVDFLLSKGADPTLKNTDGNDALGRAIGVMDNHRIQEAVTNAVLDSGAYTGSQLAEALTEAADRKSLGAARALLARGADFSAQFKNGFSGYHYSSALHQACFNSEAPENERCPMVQVMLDNPHSAGVLNEGWVGPHSETGAPIHNAAYRGNQGILQQLLEKGVWLNPPEDISREHPQTPLMSAAFGGQSEAIVFLLEKGADPFAVDSSGRNALHHLMMTDLEIQDEDDEKAFLLPGMEALLAAGTDPFALDEDNHNVLNLAENAGHTLLVRHLRERFAEQLERQLPQGMAKRNAPRL